MELAKGLVCRTHLSKIERGLVMPGKSILKALLERLGYSPTYFPEFFFNEAEAQFEPMLESIDSLLKNRQVEEAEPLIAKLEKSEEFMAQITYKQRLLALRAGVALHNGEQPEVVREILANAIKISAPNFKKEDLPLYLLTKEDIRIINMMAVLYGEEGDLNNAIDLLFCLKKNFDGRYMNNEAKGRHYPMLVYNLTKYLGMSGRYEEAIDLCDEGIKFCLSASTLRHLPLIILNKACCSYEIGDIKGCTALLEEAYYSSRMYRRFDTANNIKNYVREKNLNIVFE
jgi:transcriptional regulator with XRE-family HTH domain